MKIIQAQKEHLDIVRELFREYKSSVDAASACECFEGFEDELASLPGYYNHPKGVIYLAFSGSDYNNADAIGCVAIKPRNEKPSEAEIKRLYVRANNRASGTGKQLLSNAFMFAKTAKYSVLFLETTAGMQAAKSLYQSYGFEQTNTGENGTVECYQYLFNQDDTAD